MSLAIEGDRQKRAGDPLRLALCLANGVSADAYVAVTLPGGQTRFIVKADGDLGLSEQPRPFLDRVPPQSSTPLPLIDIAALPDEYPKGDYVLHAVVVPAGADPLDSNRWLGFAKATTGFSLQKR